MRRILAITGLGLALIAGAGWFRSERVKVRMRLRLDPSMVAVHFVGYTNDARGRREGVFVVSNNSDLRLELSRSVEVYVNRGVAYGGLSSRGAYMRDAETPKVLAPRKSVRIIVHAGTQFAVPWVVEFRVRQILRWSERVFCEPDGMLRSFSQAETEGGLHTSPAR